MIAKARKMCRGLPARGGGQQLRGKSLTWSDSRQLPAIQIGGPSPSFIAEPQREPLALHRTEENR